MKNTIYIILVCVFIFLYCSEDKVINSKPCSGDSKFVIDTSEIIAEQKNLPQSDSIQCQINNNIQYHFEGGIGYLGSVIFQVENYHWSKLFLDGGPIQNPDIIYTFDLGFSIANIPSQEDSLKINYYFEGVVGENQNCFEKFKDSLNVLIPVNRNSQ